MKYRYCRSRIPSCLLRFSLCELLIVCQQLASADNSCRSDRAAVVDLLPSPVTSLQDEKFMLDVSAANVARFHGHFAKRSPMRNVEGLLCTVIIYIKPDVCKYCIGPIGDLSLLTATSATAARVHSLH